MSHRLLTAVSIALAVAAPGCGDVVRQGRSPVMLTVSSLTDANQNLTLRSNVANGQPDMATVTLSAEMKDYLVAPTPNNQVTVNRYRVSYRRADGRNTPGVDVPYAFDGALTLTLQPAGSSGSSGSGGSSSGGSGGSSSGGSGGSGGASQFEIVRVVAKREAPLAQLATSSNVLTMIADVTFYGTDLVGNTVSATGSISIDFGNFSTGGQ